MTLGTTPNTRLWDFLASQVAPYKGPLPMMWVKFLSKRGFTKSPIEKGINQYLGSLGYTGVFAKRWAKWYNDTFMSGSGFPINGFMGSQGDGLLFDFGKVTSLWQDAAATIPANDIGEPIGRANDLRVGPNSPHNGLQSTGSFNPILQINGAKFDGTDDNLLTNYTPTGNNHFIVAKVTVPAVISATQVIAGSSSSAGTFSFHIGITTSGFLRAAAAGSNYDGAVDYRGQTVTIGWSCNGSTVKMFANGAEVLSTPQTTNNVSTTPIRIGAYNNGGTASNFFSGAIKGLSVGKQYIDLALFNQISSKL